jgi:lysophospholipase L1-like esterase
MIRRWSGALALSAIAAMAVVPASAGAAKKPAPVTPGVGYLALGDSVTFGYQEAQVVPAPNYHKASNFIGYPEMLTGGLTIANAACPGETSASLINPKAESNGCENTLGKGKGYRTLYPLHVKYKGSQLAYAVSYLKKHRNVELVSLMIGANDVFVCQEVTSDGCLAKAEQQRVLRKLAANVKVILSAIRNKARYRGQLAIVNYYSLNYTSALYTGVSTGLNKAVDGAAKPFRVVIADGYGQFKRAAYHSGAQGNTCKAGLLTQLSTGQCGVHPSYAGQALLSRALVDAIRF